MRGLFWGNANALKLNGWFHNSVNILTALESYAVNGWNRWYVSYICTKPMGKMPMGRPPGHLHFGLRWPRSPRMWAFPGNLLLPQHCSRNPDWARLDHVQINMMQRVSQSMCCSDLVIQAHYVLEASLCKRRVCKGRSRNLGTLSKREGLQQVSCGPPYMSTKSAVWKLWG